MNFHRLTNPHVTRQIVWHRKFCQIVFLKRIFHEKNSKQIYYRPLKSSIISWISIKRFFIESTSLHCNWNFIKNPFNFWFLVCKFLCFFQWNSCYFVYQTHFYLTNHLTDNTFQKIFSRMYNVYFDILIHRRKQMFKCFILCCFMLYGIFV